MNEIELVFGAGLGELSPEKAALSSNRRFVRSKSQLAIFEKSRRPTGHVLTAWEAYKTYGIEILKEAVNYGSAILIPSKGAAENALRRRREELGLTSIKAINSVASAAKLNTSAVQQAETLSAGNQIDLLEQVAFIMGLDERLIGFRESAGGDAGLAVRLKTLQSQRVDQPKSATLSARAVLTFAEAASVIRVQFRLQDWLGLTMGSRAFAPDANYGSPTHRAWQVGYLLAEDARNLLKLGHMPIESMRELVEDTLGIPVIQAQLPRAIAGATISVNDSQGEGVRGIVLNTMGDNENVWVRRATLAHELGHLLYDPDDHLENVRVDSYVANHRDPQEPGTDYVEQRANAFAIAFLAPLEEIRKTVGESIQMGSVAEVMQKYGISYTAARYHIENALYRNYVIPTETVDVYPSDDQKAKENFTLDFFPTASTSIQRRGRFSGLVAACYERGFISEQTAAGYLSCSIEEFLVNESAIRDLHPTPTS